MSAIKGGHGTPKAGSGLPPERAPSVSATLGGFLDVAAAGIGAALDADTDGDAGLQEAAWQLGRLAAVMARCLDHVAPYDQVEATWRPASHSW